MTFSYQARLLGGKKSRLVFICLFVVIILFFLFESYKKVHVNDTTEVVVEKITLKPKNKDFPDLSSYSKFSNPSDELALMVLQWTIADNKSCLKNFEFESNDFKMEQAGCKNSSIEEILDHKNYLNVNIWKKIDFSDKIRKMGKDLLSNCFGEEIFVDVNDVVSIDIDSDTKEDDISLTHLKNFVDRRPHSKFLVPYNERFSNSWKNASTINICEMKSLTRTEEMAMLSLATHHIMTNTLTSYFLALYSRSSAQIIRNKNFCEMHSNACSAYWLHMNDVGSQYERRRIPPIDDDMLKVIGPEGTQFNLGNYQLDQDHILYNRYSGFLSYTKGKYEVFSSSEKFPCCETTKWKTALYANSRCTLPKSRVCGVYKEERKEQVYCKAGGRLCNCKNYKKPGEAWIWVGKEKGKIPVVDGAEFCKVLGSRTIYVIGDSNMQQLVAVLANEILRQKGSCGNQVQIFESDNLLPLEGFDFPRMNERFEPLDKILPKIMDITGGDAVVIMTAGHHINGFAFYTSMLRFVKQYLSRFKKKYQKQIEKYDMRIYWKSQAMSHTSCANWNKPSSSPRAPITNFEASSRDSRYLSFDLLTLGYFADSNFDGFLDVSPLNNRPDAHAVDCSHFCLDPSDGTPLSDALFLLYQALSDSERGKWLYQWY